MYSAKKLLSRYAEAQRQEVAPTSAAIKKMLTAASIAALMVVLAVAPAPRANAAHSRDSRALDRAAQNQKNNGKKQQDNSDALSAALPDPQAIDLLVSQMLAAWQVGDVDAMHKYYDDDMAAISGAWEPPLVGWGAYAAAYEKQHERTQGSRLDRTNTFTKVMGDTAWVTYQWDFSGQVDGQPAKAVGHTTLVLQKRAGHWFIVLNHTSSVPTSTQASSNAAPTIPSAQAR
jgi:ketosteroid isomerase-like protein